MTKSKRKSRMVASVLSLVASPGPLVALGALVAATPSHAAAPDCTTAAAQAAAPMGMTIGPINDLNQSLPAVPAGALLVPATGSTPSYCLVTGTVVTNPSTGKTLNFGLALPPTWNQKYLESGCGGLCGVVFQTLPASPNNGGYPTDALARGYAIAATDDGHAANPPGFVFDGTFALASTGVSNPDAVADYFYRAVHTMAVAGQQFV